MGLMIPFKGWRRWDSVTFTSVGLRSLCIFHCWAWLAMRTGVPVHLDESHPFIHTSEPSRESWTLCCVLGAAVLIHMHSPSPYEACSSVVRRDGEPMPEGGKLAAGWKHSGGAGEPLVRPGVSDLNWGLTEWLGMIIEFILLSKGCVVGLGKGSAERWVLQPEGIWERMWSIQGCEKGPVRLKNSERSRECHHWAARGEGPRVCRALPAASFTPCSVGGSWHAQMCISTQ